jgi:putative FmdB family regulatory protein
VPIYDYVCSNCRHRVEVIHGINDAGPRFCPSCGFEGGMRKALATPAIHFKGSGWAKKDRSSTSGARKGSGSSSSSDAASGGSTSDGDKSASGSAAGSGSGSDAASSASSPED